MHSAARRAPLAAALIATITLGPPANAGGQTAPTAASAGREVRTNESSWFSSTAELPLSKRLTWLTDGSVRRSGGVRDPQQLLFRTGLAATLAPELRVAAGFALIQTSPYGELPATAAYPERRLWQQAQLKGQSGPLAWTHRYRLEQRWVGRTDAASDGRVLDWRYTNRMRYQLRATVPLRGHTIDVHEPYLTGTDEVMVNFGRAVRMNVFDQNRLQLSLGYMLGGGTRLEAGYMDQLVAKPDGHFLERNRTIVTAVYVAPTRRLRTPARPYAHQRRPVVDTAVVDLGARTP